MKIPVSPLTWNWHFLSAKPPWKLSKYQLPWRKLASVNQPTGLGSTFSVSTDSLNLETTSAAQGWLLLTEQFTYAR